VVNAEYNYWGAADGPAPVGSGDEISDNVDADPFRSAPPINIDPQQFVGTWNVLGAAGGPYTGSQILELDPGAYAVNILGAGSIDFEVVAPGIITSASPAVEISANTLTLRNTFVTIDPVNFQGKYWVAGEILSTSQGQQEIVVVPYVNGYVIGLYGLTPYVSFDVDADGNVTSQRPTSAIGADSTLTFLNQDVSINPVNFVGKYSVGGGILATSQGPQQIVVVPDLEGYSVGLYGLSPAILFNVDEHGTVTSQRPTSATGSANTLTFENADVTIDPVRFVGRYLVGGEILPSTQGLQQIVACSGYGWLRGRLLRPLADDPVQR
jgi:hypothetical protein